MKILFKALLFAGLFFSTFTNAATAIGGVDYLAGTRTPSDVTSALCRTIASSAHGSINEEYRVQPEANNTEACLKAATNKFKSIIMSWHNNGRACSSSITGSYPTYWMIQDKVSYQGSCVDSGSPYIKSVSATFVRLETNKQCPPKPSGQPIEDANKARYTILANARNEDGTMSPTVNCYKPLDPLDCSKLAGMSTTSSDYFVTTNAGYTHPSCVTKCGTDANGQRQCGNCKVVAKSWTQTALTLDGSMKKWTPLVGTLSGSSCAETEQDSEPPNQEKCWNSRNGLKMCQQDPAEKCVTINGVQQCEAGCGYVNGDFFCSEGGTGPNVPEPEDDNPLPDVDDTIDTPEKPMADMVKGDFKDVQRGVESRLAIVSTGIGNLENSVDTGNQILSEIESNTEGILSAEQTQLGLLGEIKDALSGNGECDPATDPNCTPPACDPSKDNCEDFETGTPKSWWNSKYPDGLQTLFSEKKASFLASDAYQAMTGEGIADSGGGPTQWQICMPFGFADYGCHTLEISAAIWAFIRACILFGAAILCRRMLIGA